MFPGTRDSPACKCRLTCDSHWQVVCEMHLQRIAAVDAHPAACAWGQAISWAAMGQGLCPLSALRRPPPQRVQSHGEGSAPDEDGAEELGSKVVQHAPGAVCVDAAPGGPLAQAEGAGRPWGAPEQTSRSGAVAALATCLGMCLARIHKRRHPAPAPAKCRSAASRAPPWSAREVQR